MVTTRLINQEDVGQRLYISDVLFVVIRSLSNRIILAAKNIEQESIELLFPDETHPLIFKEIKPENIPNYTYRGANVISYPDQLPYQHYNSQLVD